MSSVYHEEKKVAFIHVHKCAGYAMYRSLFHMEDNSGSGWNDIKNNDHAHEIMKCTDELIGSRFRNSAHFRALDMKQFLGEEKYQSFASFACVRNPWQRAYSWYRFLKKNDKKGRHHELVKNWEFDEFLQFCIDHFYLPQYQWLVDETGSIIVDHIIRFEHLATEWPRLSQKLIGRELRLPVLNKSKMNARNNEFDKVRKSTLVRFRERYAQDFELLGYDDFITEANVQSEQLPTDTQLQLEKSLEDLADFQKRLTSAQNYGDFLQSKYDQQSVQNNQFRKQLTHTRRLVTRLKSKSESQKRQIDNITCRSHDLI